MTASSLRSVSTTPSPPSWRREGRSRESSWRRRGGTQSEAGERPQSGALTPLGAHSAGTSRDSSTVRGHGGHRWSTYDPASAGVSPGLMTSSYHSCQDSSMARDKEDSGNMSTVRSTNSYLSYRQPYMGWRSLERLKLSGQSCLTPEQRLAASLLNQVSAGLYTIHNEISVMACIPRASSAWSSWRQLRGPISDRGEGSCHAAVI